MLKKYIKSNVRYPPNAFKNKEQGRVFVSYFLDKKGNVKKTRIARSVSFFLDKEALRVVNNMPKWTPEIQYGELVERRYTIPISFGLQ
jgi:TonB family protein